jgi:hypothetical protein
VICFRPSQTKSGRSVKYRHVQKITDDRLQQNEDATEEKHNFPHETPGRDSSVYIATRYRLDGPGIETRWGRDFPTFPERPWGPPSLLYNGYRVFPAGKAAGAWR